VNRYGSFSPHFQCGEKHFYYKDRLAEFRDWLTYQCTDGYGERLVQHPVQTKEGTAYLSFRSAVGDSLIYSASELSL
jgi:hypothetical protein